MEKIPTSPRPISEASTTSESPTLSDHPHKHPKNVKRKRSNIFTKLRNSILGTADGDGKIEEAGAGESHKRNVSLKRAMSIDSGLQTRISQLITSSSSAANTQDPFNPETQIKRRSGIRNRRSKSLHQRNNSLEQVVESSSTNPTSPTIGGIFDTETPLLTRTTSLMDTVDLSNVNEAFAMNQRFNCSWLAPTRRPQLFPGTLSLHPHSSSIQFHCQHFNRTIRLQFNFQDMLNIAQGTWNDARNQALIIDLVKGKRKSWVFVAWSEDQFSLAVECFVKAWSQYTSNQVQQRITRKNAHLNMKYCKIIRDADKANESTKSSVLFQNAFSNVINVLMKPFKSNPEVELIRNVASRDFSLKTLIYDTEIDCITPQILSLILTDRASNFMTNFRALQGIVITNDSGWKRPEKRSFNCLITKEDDRMRAFKWRITQELLIDDPDLVVTRSTFSPLNESPKSSSSTFFLITSISSVESHFKNPKCHIKITGELKRRAKFFLSEDQLCEYFRKHYYKQLFVLLEALINESQNDFQTFKNDFCGEKVLPQYRFLKESIKVRLLMLNVGFTTVILPFLYKLIHFKEFKYARILILSLITLQLLKHIHFTYIWNSFRNNGQINFDDAFRDYMKDLANEALEGEGPIHSIKLKYNP